MKESQSTYESAVALAQLKFFYSVTEIISEYSAFVASLIKNKSTAKPLKLLKPDETVFKAFSETKNKELLDHFKALQTTVLEKVKELEAKDTKNTSISFEFSDISDSPKTPKRSPKKFFKTPQVQSAQIREKFCSKTKTNYDSEKKPRIRQLSQSQLSIAKRLF
jgi:predicted Zn-ribbon and HTH transcriptional regulator